jgi:cold shock CspA family protein
LFRLTKQLRKWNRENFEESTDSIGAEDTSSKRLKGVAAKWNPRGFGFIKPNDGGKDIFCILSSITDGNELREGDMVEYESKYDDHRGKYQAIIMTRKKSALSCLGSAKAWASDRRPYLGWPTRFPQTVRQGANLKNST